MEKETIHEFIHMASFLEDLYAQPNDQDIQQKIERREGRYFQLRQYLKNVYLPLLSGEL